MIRNPFEPKTIAVIGATDREDSPVFALQENILASGIRLYPVHPDRAAVSGVACYPTIGDVPEAVDMAVIAPRLPICPGSLRVRACGRGRALSDAASPDRSEAASGRGAPGGPESARMPFSYGSLGFAGPPRG